MYRRIKDVKNEISHYEMDEISKIFVAAANFNAFRYMFKEIAFKINPDTHMFERTGFHIREFIKDISDNSHYIGVFEQVVKKCENNEYYIKEMEKLKDSFLSLVTYDPSSEAHKVYEKPLLADLVNPALFYRGDIRYSQSLLHKTAYVKNFSEQKIWQTWEEFIENFSPEYILEILSGKLSKTYNDKRNYIKFFGLTTNKERFLKIRDSITDSLLQRPYSLLAFGIEPISNVSESEEYVKEIYLNYLSKLKQNMKKIVEQNKIKIIIDINTRAVSKLLGIASFIIGGYEEVEIIFKDKNKKFSTFFKISELEKVPSELGTDIFWHLEGIVENIEKYQFSDFAESDYEEAVYLTSKKTAQLYKKLKDITIISLHGDRRMIERVDSEQNKMMLSGSSHKIMQYIYTLLAPQAVIEEAIKLTEKTVRSRKNIIAANAEEL